SLVNERYELVTLKNGARSVRSVNDGEIFHPVAGPIAEAETLYVRQLRLRERIEQWGTSGVTPKTSPAPVGETPSGASGTVALPGEFVIWDVGLGAGGNALTAMRQLTDIAAELRIVSFDRTLEALRFAVQHAAELQFPLGFEEPIRAALEGRECT